MLGQAVTVSGQLVPYGQTAAPQPSVLNPRTPGRRPQRAQGSTYPARYDGPFQQRQLVQRPRQYHPGNVGGTFVQANPYWTATGQTPPSPICQRTAGHTGKRNPDLGSDAQAAAEANAASQGHTGREFAVAGVAGLTTSSQGNPVPIIGANEIRFSANPIARLNQLGMVGASRELSSELAPAMNSPVQRTKKSKSIWLFGYR